MKVYDPEGKAHEKDPVDARECVEHCGYTYEPPEASDKADAQNSAAEGDDKGDGTEDSGAETKSGNNKKATDAK